MSSFQSRILVAVIGVPVLVWVVLFSPSVVLMAALALLAGLGGRELQCCVGSDRHSAITAFSTAFPLLAVLCIWARPEWLTACFAAEVVFFFGYAIFRGGEIKFPQIMAALFAGIVIAYSFAGFVRMEAAGIHRGVLLLPFILSFACDTFAYFAGRAFGKHKLAPKVSPKKTIEGSVGGLLGNLACGELFVLVMEHLCGGSPIGYGAMAVLALLCGIVAQIGDLSFSLIKREYGIKDYGRLFLEHGGVLDRFDSVLFVTPVIELVLYAVMK